MSVIRPSRPSIPTTAHEIRRLIAQNRLDEAAGLLEKLLTRRTDLRNMLLVIRNGMRELNSKRAAGLLTPAEEALQQAKHVNGMLEVLQMFESDGDRTPYWSHSRRLVFWLIVAMLTLLATLWWWKNQQSGHERRAYDTALQAGTIPACRAYLKAYGQHEHAAEIQGKLNTLETEFQQYLQNARAMRQAGLEAKAGEFLQKARRINPEDSTLLQLQKEFSQ